MNFAKQYWDLLIAIIRDGETEHNVRTGTKIKALAGGRTLMIDLIDRMLPTCGVRRTWPHISAAELMWCIRGDNHIDWLRRHTKTYDAFAKPSKLTIDGKSKDGPRFLDQSYGFRWRRKFGRDQLALGVEAIRNDPTDRRVFISSWDPSLDGLGAKDQSTVPCPVGFTFSVLHGRLHSTLLIRSSDVFVGLPYDVMRHTMLMAVVATSVGAEPGILQLSIAHPHLYDKHWEMAKIAMQKALVVPPIPLLQWPLEMCERYNDEFVTTYKSIAAVSDWPEYNPKPELVV